MKLNKSLLTLLTTVTLTTLLGAAPITVKASNYSSNVTANQKKHYVIKNTHKLSKWGYVLNVNSSALPIFVGKSNYQKLLNNPYFKGTKSVSPKRLKNVRFKIVKIMVFKDVNGTPEYLITSKNHKYNTWTPNAGLQYYDIHSKYLQRVMKPLKKIKERDLRVLNRKIAGKESVSGQKRIVQNKHDFDLAVKSARKLKGNQRKFVLGSLHQMKQDDGIRNVMQEKQNNILLWTIN